MSSPPPLQATPNTPVGGTQTASQPRTRVEVKIGTVVGILGVVLNLLKVLVEIGTELKKLPVLNWLSGISWWIVASLCVVPLLAVVLLRVRGFTRRSRLVDPDRL